MDKDENKLYLCLIKHYNMSIFGGVETIFLLEGGLLEEKKCMGRILK
jgi:hypothetical protein